MSSRDVAIPVVLFVYARTAHLARVLRCLRENRVPLIEAFADGPKGSDDAPMVDEARALLRAIDWCEVRIVERQQNLGLGKNILAGVSEVAERHDAFIVWEDDLVAVPGTYAWMCAALRRFAGDERVMSVTAWTHPRVTPGDVGSTPYFDGRAECWVWGTWARSWRGMASETALEKLASAARRGVDINAYGGDLPRMAMRESTQNIWAVRWLYHHLQYTGLCLRPPWSMVEHIGIDASATNAQHATDWTNPPLRAAPPIPAPWAEPKEHPDCRRLWRSANPAGWKAASRAAVTRVRSVPQRFLPASLRRWVRRMRRGAIFHGDYASWSDAQRDSRGYADRAILNKVVEATRAVRDGRALWERDTVLFNTPAANDPLLRALLAVAKANDNELNVLDFGGSLGSTWWQHRAWLEHVHVVRWAIVEQPELVEIGQREFSIGPLRFYRSIAECCELEQPKIVVLSSVLPYLENPHALIADITQRDFNYVIIDRTGFVSRGRDRLTVQNVPRSVYEASYPCWFFDRARLLADFGDSWSVVQEWANSDDIDINAEYRGLMLRRKRASRISV